MFLARFVKSGRRIILFRGNFLSICSFAACLHRWMIAQKCGMLELKLKGERQTFNLLSVNYRRLNIFISMNEVIIKVVAKNATLQHQICIKIELPRFSDTTSHLT